MQVAEVTTPLGSVRAFVRAGNRVVFDEEESYIENKATGVRTDIEDRNGVYMFDLWIPRGKSQNSQGGQGYQGKYFQALVEQDEDDHECMGFVGPDDFF